MIEKKQARLRRATQTRAKIAELKFARLTVHRSNSHIYAQVIDANSKVLAVASSLEPAVRKDLKNGGNVQAAAAVGKRIAEIARSKGVESVAFDRSGFKFHGRVKALADAAREGGLKLEDSWLSKKERNRKHPKNGMTAFARRWSPSTASPRW